ncbi:E3 ubiquitin-protein ligase [Canna indica]|uniref:E3 ubiquitin-protein ligase n=1 Tax=Canna indica TaxID=4628 RepID=A0AAQ3QF99_9LILI|nr:E3 ubiquitin-protein ligase [Canna indica]
MEFETKGKQVNVHYMNIPEPNVVEENFGGYIHEYDFALAVELQNQEFQKDIYGDLSGNFSGAGSRPTSGHGKSREEKNPSKTVEFESQLALDHALARKLQDLENQLSGSTLGENTIQETNVTPAQSSTTNAERNPTRTSYQTATEDDIDPDNMSYEELERLGEAMGAESKGLSDELISFLPTSTYKTGLFSKKGKQEECVICRMAYKNRDELITLPSCQHQYHKDCINKWLKINKACPVCKEEVFGS